MGTSKRIFARVIRLSEAFSTFAIRLVLYFRWISLAWFSTAVVYRWRNKAALSWSLNFLLKILWHQRSFIFGTWIELLLFVCWASRCIPRFLMTNTRIAFTMIYANTDNINNIIYLFKYHNIWRLHV